MLDLSSFFDNPTSLVRLAFCFALCRKKRNIMIQVCMDVMEQGKKRDGSSPDFVLMPTSPTQAVGDDVADSSDPCVTFEVDDDDNASSVESRVIPHVESEPSHHKKNASRAKSAGFLEDLRKRIDDFVKSTDEGEERAVTYDEAMAIAARVHRERLEKEAAESAAVLNVADSAPASPAVHSVISPRLIAAHANSRAARPTMSLMDNDPCYVQVLERGRSL
mmetsp:Transcript_7585/g.23435  ORF Transcript_7585/g.23435 Transcript_7585/m.23435 type:complete len:220 (-) Transcript_7585:177-836(-)